MPADADMAYEPEQKRKKRKEFKKPDYGVDDDTGSRQPAEAEAEEDDFYKEVLSSSLYSLIIWTYYMKGCVEGRVRD